MDSSASPKSTFGVVHPAGHLFFCIHVGSAHTEKFTFVLSYAAGGNREPLVQCEQTKKTFALSWEAILDLAIAAGVTES